MSAAADRPFLAGGSAVVPLPILATVPGPQPWGPIPLVCVDVGDRPDIRDLARLLVQEGGGLLRGDWPPTTDAGPGSLTLRVTAVSPARCAFQITFDPERDRAFLEAATRGDVLAVALGPPEQRDAAVLGVRHAHWGLAALLCRGTP